MNSTAARALAFLSLCSFFFLLGSFYGSRTLFFASELPIPPLNSSAFNLLPFCHPNFSDYIPCHNPLISRERYCPGKSEHLKCRIPAPFGYRKPISWPLSREQVWSANVPRVIEKANRNIARFKDDRFTFPGGRGVDNYIDGIGHIINLRDGSIRTVIDSGCGVASWGAYLLERDILPLSFAPKDFHDPEVQFALERGIPALIGILASKRLPYPSRAFDMAHCSRCLIPWDHFGGLYLIEMDRILRPGGYWVLSGPPINWEKHSKGWKRSVQDLMAAQTRIEEIAYGLCWKKLKRVGDIVVWQKPTNHLNCKKIKNVLKSLPGLCKNQNPDQAWETDMEDCLTRLPEVSNKTKVAGGRIPTWPLRLTAVPPRIASGSLDGVTPDVFRQDIETWKKRIFYYKSLSNELAQRWRYRNFLDMNAHLGGFAAALVIDPVWVMNVVPVEANVNTLGAIFERGLIGTYHSWCEAMSTYPRTYDFIHADSVFTLYKDRCEMEDILLEMDRILRPGGSVIMVDHVDMVWKIKHHTDEMQWGSRIFDHEKGPHHREKLLVAVKQYWTVPAAPLHHHIFLHSNKSF